MNHIYISVSHRLGSLVYPTQMMNQEGDEEGFGRPGLFQFIEGDDTKSRLFCYGKWNDITSTELLQSLTPAEVVKLRQLSLISLCEPHRSVSYATIGVELGLQNSEIEPFVLKAIIDGAIDGIIDAQNHQLLVRNTAVRNA